MKTYFTEQEAEQVVEAIRSLELRTTAELRVCVTHKRVWRLQRYAREVFQRLDMHKTRERNGALIVLFVRRRKMHVLGDVGLNEKVGADFWSRVVARMEQHFREGNRVAAVHAGIQMIAEEMVRHWPSGGDENPNELSDDLIYD